MGYKENELYGKRIGKKLDSSGSLEKLKSKRKFDGEEFHLYDTSFKKSTANKIKEKLKADNKKVRIIKHKIGYGIYFKK